MITNHTYDVYILENIDPKVIPSDLYSLMISRIKSGSIGLVSIGSYTNITSQCTLNTTNFIGKPNGVTFYDFGKGIVASLALPSVPSTYTIGWNIKYDNWQLNLGSTVLWVARKQPLVFPTLISNMTNNQNDITISLPSNHNVAKIYLRQRRSTDEFETQSTEITVLDSTSPFIKTVSFNFPVVVLSESYSNEVICYNSQGKVVSFSCVYSEFISPAPTTSFNLILNSTSAEINEKINGIIHIIVPENQTCDVSLEFRDRHSRLLIANTHEFIKGMKNISFSIAIEEWFPQLVHIRSLLTCSNYKLDSQKYFSVIKRRRDKFLFLSWDLPNNPTGFYAQEALSKLGVKAELLSGAKFPLSLDAFEMSIILYSTRILNDVDSNGIIKPTTWNKEPDIQTYVDGIVSKYAMPKNSVYAYSLGDETVTRGYDISPSDLISYQAFLSASYNSNIDMLNNNWGTTFTSFSQIQLLNSTDATEIKAKTAGNYARWFDRQAWASQNFLNLCSRFVSSYKKADPNALTGFEGAGLVNSGDDFDGIINTNTWYTPYPGEATDIVRSLAPSNFPHSNWMGYSKIASELKKTFWEITMNGGTGVFWWRWSGVGRFNGLLRPDYVTSPQVKEMLEDTHLTRAGLGDLLLKSVRETDGITVVYSQSSAYSVSALSTSYNTFASGHLNWQRNLKELGYGYRYMTNAMLKRGEIYSNTKVLVLIRTESLSASEVSYITQFVENGGTVITDIRPGRFNDHLNPIIGSGLLDSLFGINSTSSSAVYSPGTALIDLGNGAIWCPNIKFDKGIVPTTAKVYGNMTWQGYSVVLENSIGTKGGKAILINMAMYDTVLPVVDILLQKAGVVNKISVTKLNSTLGRLQISRWTNGQVVIAGILSEGSGWLNFKLWEARHAVNMKTGIDEGIISTKQLYLNAGEANFFAFFPSTLTINIPIPKVTVISGDYYPKLGSVVKLSISVPGAFSDHGIHISATIPDGSNAAEWINIVDVIPRDGSLTVPIPFALNDPKGIWNVVVKDIFGSKVNVPLHVGETQHISEETSSYQKKENPTSEANTNIIRLFILLIFVTLSLK